MAAMPISGDQRSPHRWWYHPGGAADVDRFGVCSEDDPVDDGVTGGFPYLIGGKDLTGGGFMDPATVAL
jgi:hypothetical protein